MSQPSAPTPARLFRANLRRALTIASVVGTAFLLINHGDHLVREPVCPHFFIRTSCGYLVPFVVSMVSAMLAARPRD